MPKVTINIEDLDDPEDKLKFSDLFEFIAVIGSGSFGMVVAAKEKSTGLEYAIKIIQKEGISETRYKIFRKESEILRQLDHPNVVKFYKVIESDKKFFLLMEWVKGGNLNNFIHERISSNQPLDDEECAKIMKSIFSCVEYLHSKDVIHRDLKPENILIQNRKNLSSIKICDFGLSAQYEDEYGFRIQGFMERCGTKVFMAPELWFQKRYGKAVDIWSCGIIMYMILKGKHPLYEENDNDESYTNKLENPNWAITSPFNKWSENLFLKLVHMDPFERYTSRDALLHPWILRNFDNDMIPMGEAEKVSAIRKSHILGRVVKLVYLLISSNLLNTEEDYEYSSIVRESEYRNTTIKTDRTSLSPNRTLQSVIQSIQSNNLEVREKLYKSQSLDDNPILNDSNLIHSAHEERKTGFSSRRTLPLTTVNLITETNKTEHGTSIVIVIPEKRTKIGMERSTFLPTFADDNKILDLEDKKSPEIDCYKKETTENNSTRDTSPLISPLKNTDFKIKLKKIIGKHDDNSLPAFQMRPSKKINLEPVRKNSDDIKETSVSKSRINDSESPLHSSIMSIKTINEEASIVRGRSPIKTRLMPINYTPAYLKPEIRDIIPFEKRNYSSSKRQDHSPVPFVTIQDPNYIKKPKRFTSLNGVAQDEKGRSTILPSLKIIKPSENSKSYIGKLDNSPLLQISQKYMKELNDSFPIKRIPSKEIPNSSSLSPTKIPNIRK